MPSKQSLLDSHQDSSELMKWAKDTHNVCEKFVFIKKQVDGQVTVRCCMEANNSDQFEGSGVSKKDAIADALAQRFPA